MYCNVFYPVRKLNVFVLYAVLITYFQIQPGDSESVVAVMEILSGKITSTTVHHHVCACKTKTSNHWSYNMTVTSYLFNGTCYVL